MREGSTASVPSTNPHTGISRHGPGLPGKPTAHQCQCCRTRGTRRNSHLFSFVVRKYLRPSIRRKWPKQQVCVRVCEHTRHSARHRLIIIITIGVKKRKIHFWICDGYCDLKTEILLVDKLDLPPLVRGFCVFFVAVDGKWLNLSNRWARWPLMMIATPHLRTRKFLFFMSRCLGISPKPLWLDVEHNFCLKWKRRLLHYLPKNLAGTFIFKNVFKIWLQAPYLVSLML